MHPWLKSNQPRRLPETLQGPPSVHRALLSPCGLNLSWSPKLHDNFYPQGPTQVPGAAGGPKRVLGSSHCPIEVNLISTRGAGPNLDKMNLLKGSSSKTLYSKLEFQKVHTFLKLVSQSCVNNSEKILMLQNIGGNITTNKEHKMSIQKLPTTYESIYRNYRILILQFLLNSANF